MKLSVTSNRPMKVPYNGAARNEYTPEVKLQTLLFLLSEAISQRQSWLVYINTLRLASLF
jgi:hypothetical protein